MSGLVTLPATGATSSTDEPESANAALEACVESQITANSRKTNPNVDQLLERCKSELGAVLVGVPEELREQIEHDIRHDIVQQMKRRRD